MKAPTTAFFDHGEVVIDGVRFVGTFSLDARDDGVPIRKRPDLIERYVALFDRFSPQGIVELGVAAGGGVALLTLLAEPTWLAAFELSSDPVPNLERFLLDRALGETVEVFLGVDQGDGDRLRGVVERRLREAPLELVVDDASHLYGPSLRSFEVLFPLLAPGGRYIIEDWNAALHDAALLAEQLRGQDPSEAERVRRAIEAAQAASPGEVPLPRLAMDLVLAASSAPAAISRVEVDRYWVTVHRGPAVLDEATFSLAGIAPDDMHLLHRR